MLLTKAVQDGIVAGNITLVFRRWQKPSVKSGGRLKTAVGELAIGSVMTIDPFAISDADAQAAGWSSAALLVEDLFRERTPSTRGRGARSDGDRLIYRIEVSYAGADERIALRQDAELSDDQLREIVDRLDGFDRRSSHGAWTHPVMTLIDQWPGRRAPELAEMVGRETLPFKADVRKLKTLGLTESLTVGYRLSPRGQRVLTFRSQDTSTSSQNRVRKRSKLS
jgi:hypothetical protein